MSLYPSAELVARDWIRSLPELDVNGVATSLPGDFASFKTKGFVQVSVVGGSPDIDVPMMVAVVQIDCWTYGGSKPPWNLAGSIAGTILHATYKRASMGKVLSIADGDYYTAQVRHAFPLTTPRNITNNDSNQSNISLSQTGLARVQFDMEIRWTVNA